MSGGSFVEGALRRERLLVVSALVAVVVLLWAYLLLGAGMSMHDMGGMVMPMQHRTWTFGYAPTVLLMWAAMMAAMMLPSAAPMILLFGTIARRREQKGDETVGAAVFALGYFVVWAGFSVIAAALQFGLDQAALLSPAMRTTSKLVAGGVLIGAGIYQWTPLKQACLRRCRSPLEFLMTEWRPESRGAFVMGLRHGTYCLGCCWVLMLLLFVGGVMNIAWIIGLVAFVLVEKFAPAGGWVSTGAGLALAAWGTATIAS